jgi:hypothetical protein
MEKHLRDVDRQHFTGLTFRCFRIRLQNKMHNWQLKGLIPQTFIVSSIFINSTDSYADYPNLCELLYPIPNRDS